MQLIWGDWENSSAVVVLAGEGDVELEMPVWEVAVEVEAEVEAVAEADSVSVAEVVAVVEAEAVVVAVLEVVVGADHQDTLWGLIVLSTLQQVAGLLVLK